MSYRLEAAPDASAKKYRVTLPDGRSVMFGARGYSDYTIHKDPERQKRYIQRHQARENWGKTGIHTPGFWSRWILWNKPSLQASIQNAETKFNIRIALKTRH